MKNIKYFIIITAMLLTACAGEATKNHDDSGIQSKETEEYLSRQLGADYVRTGFYFVADKLDEKSINMREHKSNTVYILARVPFAGIKNIVKSKLEKTPNGKGGYTELCLTFDAEGTKHLSEGTGNPAHPKIAAVVANRLLFVAENSVSIKTGVMCVGLVGFSEQEIETIKHDVDLKK